MIRMTTKRARIRLSDVKTFKIFRYGTSAVLARICEHGGEIADNVALSYRLLLCCVSSGVSTRFKSLCFRMHWERSVALVSKASANTCRTSWFTVATELRDGERVCAHVNTINSPTLHFSILVSLSVLQRDHFPHLKTELYYNCNEALILQSVRDIIYSNGRSRWQFSWTLNQCDIKSINFVNPFRVPKLSGKEISAFSNEREWN